jgi:hypothetical protein
VRSSRLHCRTALFNFVHQLAAGEGIPRELRNRVACTPLSAVARCQVRLNSRFANAWRTASKS